MPVLLSVATSMCLGAVQTIHFNALCTFLLKTNGSDCQTADMTTRMAVPLFSIPLLASSTSLADAPMVAKLLMLCTTHGVRKKAPAYPTYSTPLAPRRLLGL